MAVVLAPFNPSSLNSAFSSPTCFSIRQVLSNRDESAQADLNKLVESQAGKTKLALEAAKADVAEAMDVVVKPEKRPSRTREVLYLTKRAWDMAVRNPVVVRARAAQFIVMALVFGAVYIVRRALHRKTQMRWVPMPLRSCPMPITQVSSPCPCSSFRACPPPAPCLRGP